MAIRENAVEARLRDRMKAVGGKAYKFTSPGADGVPDRICVFPNGRIVFVETKAPSVKDGLSERQKKEHRRLREMGCMVLVLRTYEEIEDMMMWYGPEHEV